MAFPINFEMNSDYPSIQDLNVSLKGFFTDMTASVIQFKHLVDIMRRQMVGGELIQIHY